MSPGHKFHFPTAKPSGNLRAGAGDGRRTKQPGGRASDVVKEASMEVEMKIRGLMMDPVTNMPIVVLKDVQGQAILPIWVGVYEANAIALEIEKVQTPRPMTHDLLKNVLLGLDVRVQKIVVNDLKDDTFFALIWVEREGQMMTIASRPSDALALALRIDCPIFVDDAALQNSNLSSQSSERSTNEQLRNYLDGLSDEDLGRYKM